MRYLGWVVQYRYYDDDEWGVVTKYHYARDHHACVAWDSREEARLVARQFREGQPGVRTRVVRLVGG